MDSPKIESKPFLYFDFSVAFLKPHTENIEFNLKFIDTQIEFDLFSQHFYQ